MGGQRGDVFWLYDVLQGKSAHQRFFFANSRIDVHQGNLTVFFFTLSTSTEQRVLKEIHFPHQYSPLSALATLLKVWSEGPKNVVPLSTQLDYIYVLKTYLEAHKLTLHNNLHVGMECLLIFSPTITHKQMHKYTHTHKDILFSREPCGRCDGQQRK